MKSIYKTSLFVLTVLAMATACQSKKTEGSEVKMDTATVVESETIIQGDSMEVVTDSAKVVMPDSTKK